MASRPEPVARHLRSLVRGDVEFDSVTRQLYSTDAGLTQIEPLGVVAPRDAEDVAALVTFAREAGLSLVPRGTGSGLAGGAVGPGIQVDFNRYMNQIIGVAPDGLSARVQPGVIMAELNRHVKSYGTFFAPDPSSENYCSLGGMIGTNSSGSRSVAYGGTKDHVLGLEVVLSDGSRFAAKALSEGSPALTGLLEGETTAGRAYSAILPDLQGRRETIFEAMPRVVKNCSGYRIETILSGTEVRLQNLFVGAEGTLGLVTEATLNLVPLARERGIAMAYFPSVFASGEAVPGILALGPSALEIMDSRFLALVRSNDSRIDSMLPDQTDTALLIEFEGADQGELDARFAALADHLRGTAILELVRPKSAEEAARLWTVRKSAVALVLRMPGPRRALPFIEDVTVHPTEVAGYVDFLQKLFDRFGVESVMYGHVGDGNIHTRPLLDAKDESDLRTMQRIYDEVSEYVLEVRGTMSGEHGDGLLRTPYVKRMYGDEIYDLFSRIKDAFDPEGVLNPGKKVGPQETADPLRQNLRYGVDYRTHPQKPLLHFPGGEYEREIEKCHGCAQCKSVVVTTMCPTYKATRREHASPRAKANVLRAVISGHLDPESTYGQAAMKSVTDYCIVCGMCALECPSRVDIPKLMLEAKSKYRAAHRGTPVEMILGRAETVSKLGRLTAPVANRLVNMPAARRLAQPFVGVDHRRPLAPFARPTYSEIVARRGPAAGSSASGPMVAFFYDLFAEYNDPELALVVERLLEAHGLRVVAPEQRASGIPEMLYGYAKQARKVAEYNVQEFLPLVRQGAVLVSSEPTASFAFKVHYPDYLSSPECSLVANAARDLGEFLVRRRADHPETAPPVGPLSATVHKIGPLTTGPAPVPGHAVGRPLRVAYHLPCHLKAQEVGAPSRTLLEEIPGTEVVDLDAGCCGMAGTFGMKAGTYDFSLAVGRPLFERMAEVAPDMVATECSTCRMQIAQATGIDTVHPIMLLAEAYGL